MRKMIIILGLFCAISKVAAESEKPQSIPEFLGGLDVADIVKCEKNLRAVCSMAEENKLDLSKQGLCMMTKKMPNSKNCIQANKIRELTAYLPTKIKKYEAVTVFNITTLADGQDMFYMVDIQGKLIPLTTRLELTKNKIYHQIRKKYPNVALTSFLYWTKKNENIFPHAYTLSNKDQMLVFKQELRDGVCVACQTVGVAFIAYEFDYKGAYLKSRLLKVELPSKT